MTTIDLDELAALPSTVRRLQARIEALEARAASPDDGQLLDAVDAAKLLSMTPRALRQAAWHGSIPSVKVGRRLRFRRSDIVRSPRAEK